MGDILIFGGFNMLGYQIVKMVIQDNLFANIIIDTLNEYLLKDNKIKQ